MPRCDIAIIGGGILGTCISYWLSSLYDMRVCIIEKEPDVAMHASSKNTAVIHSPFYLDPKTKKILAKSALASHSMWEGLAKKESIPWNRTGILELALDEEQHKSLEKYMRWGDENGINPQDMDLLESRQVSQMEPNVECHSALFCRREVSTDFGALTDAVRKESERHGTSFLFGENVTGINTDGSHPVIDLDGGSVDTKFVINCAGGNSLDIAQMMGLATEYSDLHFRGEYWVADPPHDSLVKTTVYTVARFPQYPFLDPHWIKKADGSTEVGPNAVPVPSPETYEGYVGDIGTSLLKLKDVITGNAKRLLSDPDFLSLVSKEWISSLSKNAMINRVQKFVPKVRPEFFSKRGTAGIRSPVITPQGRFLPDVMEVKDDYSYHIINYNSPGATGTPAYSAFVVKNLQDRGFLSHEKDSGEMLWSLDDILDRLA